MKVNKLRPFVPSGKDYALAQSFFEDLGFEKIYSDEGLSIFQIGEQEFFLQNFDNQEFQNNFMVELIVEDLDMWWEHIQKVAIQKNYSIRVTEPTTQPWGKREITLIDLAGVCWHISEVIT
jgi:hypothetical protein